MSVQKNAPAPPATQPSLTDSRAELRRPTAAYRWIYWLALPVAALAFWAVARNYWAWDNFGTVEPGQVYRCGQLLPGQLEKLIKRYKIKTIIKTNIPDLSLADMGREREVCRRHYVRVAALIMPGDGRGEFAQYDQALALLCDQRNLPALITCARGTHRTGAVVAVYRVLAQHWTVARALAEMEDYRFDPGGQWGRAKHPLTEHLHTYFKERLDHE